MRRPQILKTAPAERLDGLGPIYETRIFEPSGPPSPFENPSKDHHRRHDYYQQDYQRRPVDGRRKITDNRDNQNEKTNKPRLLAVDRRPPN